MDIAERTLQLKTDFDNVYEAGKKSQYDAFWDVYQENGNRIDYQYAFAYKGWKKDAFKPRYDIRPTGSGGAYMFSNGGTSSNYDLAKALEEQSVVLDLSKLTSSTCEFYLSRFTNLPILDFSGCTSMAGTFDYYQGYVIRLILSDEGTTTFTNVFRRCYNLTTVIIESGVIGRSISFSDSPLIVASLKNIISHLKDYAEDTANHYKNTVTFKTSAFNVLESEGATAEYNGVACTWAELIDNKKWNLVKG